MTPPKARIVVLSSGTWAWETVQALAQVDCAEVVGVVMTPAYRPLPFVRRVRRAIRYNGWLAPITILWGRLRPRHHEDVGQRPHGLESVPLLHVADIRAPEAVDALRNLNPDVTILDGCPIIPPAVLSVPRLGTVNIHCGRLPDYRGAPPAFWELFNGEREVGVTIHRAAAELDAGPILAQCMLPLNPAPPGNAEQYARTVWLTQLRPAAHQLLRDCLPGFVAGTASEVKQESPTAPANRLPTRRQRRELHRRVAARSRDIGRLLDDKATR